MGDVATIADQWLARKLPNAMQALGIVATAKVFASIDTPYPPASKPGEPPHKRTGNLAAGVDHKEMQDGSDYFSIIESRRAQGDPDVPAYLEFGTWKMAARPYVRPVMYQAEQFVPEVMARSLDAEATHAAAG